MKTHQRTRILHYPVIRDPGVQGVLKDLRYQGYRGGFIFKHRALLTLPRNLSKAVSTIVLAILLFVGWLFVMKWVTVGWAYIMDFWRAVLGLGGYVTLSHYSLWGLYNFTVPYLHLTSGPPDYLTLLIGGLATLLFALITFFLPRRHLPIIYLLRVIVFFHACAQVFFAFIPISFPYGASGYIHGVLVAGLALISLMPIVLGFTFYIFDIRFIKKVVLSLVIMLHLILLIPIQFVAHGYILHHLSLLFLPILFFVFGLPLDVLIFMAFYSWGASWKDTLLREGMSQEA